MRIYANMQKAGIYANMQKAHKKGLVSEYAHERE